MTDVDPDDVMVRAAQWVPVVLFHANLFRTDPATIAALLDADNPLAQLVPSDILMAVMIALSLVADCGDLDDDDLGEIIRQVGANTLPSPPP